MHLSDLSQKEYTVYHMLKAYAERYEEKTAIEYKGENGPSKVSFRRFFEDCCKAANYLKKKGISKDAVALSGKTSYPYVVFFTAAMFNGNTSFPINPELETDVTENALERRKPAILLFSEDYPTLTSIAAKKAFQCVLIEEAFKEAETEDADFEEDSEICPWDTCLNLLTSGTTGIPKIVMSNHFLFGHNIGRHPGSRLLFVFPFHHLTGILFFSNMIGRGDTACLSAFANAVNDLSYYKPDVLLTVPALLKVLIRLDKAKLLDLSGMKVIGTGAAPPDPHAFEYLLDKGIEAINFYGSTECGGEMNSYGTDREHVCSIGDHSPYFEKKITPEGELLLKGRTVMNGYFEDAEATAKVLKDSWYYTGDACYRDEAGFYFITGRMRNIIVLSNGENVSPEAIEASLEKCDRIRMSMVSQKEDRIVAEIYYGDEMNEQIENEIREFVDRYNEGASFIHRIKSVSFRYTPFKTTSNGKLIRK